MSTGASAAILLPLALLPGAFFQWAFERNAGRYGITLRDRLVRITGISAIFLSASAWPLHRIYANYWTQFKEGHSLPTLMYVAPVAYILIPLVLGWLYGYSIENNWSVTRSLAGKKRFPTAWDYAFSTSHRGWIRCQLQSGEWVRGMYSSTESPGHTSYATGYPEPHELYLFPIVEMDQENGSFCATEKGEPLLGLGGLLIRWEEIAMLNFIADEGEGATNDE